jgi:hypothetical protein
MAKVPGGPAGGRKRSYHKPTLLEFGSVSETTATWENFQNEYIPSWFQQPQDVPGGGGLS